MVDESLKKDELIEQAEGQGIAVDPSDTKAEIVEKLEVGRVTNPDFDPKNPGGRSFAYGEAPKSDTDFDPDNPGGVSFDYGQRPEE